MAKHTCPGTCWYKEKRGNIPDCCAALFHTALRAYRASVNCEQGGAQSSLKLISALSSKLPIPSH